MNNVKNFVGLGWPVHVGRVNSMKRLRVCEDLGVDSVDGTGWFRARDRKYYDFIDPKQPIYFSRIGTHIGNAVPPRLGYIIGKSIKEHIEGVT